MHPYISEVIKYYSRQGHPVTVREVYRFSTHIMREDEIARQLDDDETLQSYEHEGESYYFTPHTPAVAWQRAKEAKNETIKKLQMISLYIKILQNIPTISAVMLTGSCSIDNAHADDDIDLMICTSPGWLYTTRFIVVIISFILGLKRAPDRLIHRDTVCTNLWFDVSDLTVPLAKRSLYAAREIAQMKVIIDKSHYIKEFISANPWINDHLPNFLTPTPVKIAHTRPSHLVETLMYHAQLTFMRRRQTRELVTMTQMWFHPIDRSDLTKDDLSREPM